MSLSIKTKTITQTTNELRLNDRELRDLIRQATGQEIPWGATIYVEVPGGGDWSNSDLEINSACPVIIKWTTQEIVE